MTQQQLIELIQVHHPDLGETELRLLLNQAQREFTDRTNLGLETSDTFSTDGSAMYYEMNSTNLGSITNTDDDVIEITRIDYDGEPVSRLVNALEIEDS